jgi:hypothetical protein
MTANFGGSACPDQIGILSESPESDKPWHTAAAKRR